MSTATEPDSLIIEAAYPCGHVEAGVVVAETRQDGETVRHRLPPMFVPHDDKARLCMVCDRLVNPEP